MGEKKELRRELEDERQYTTALTKRVAELEGETQALALALATQAPQLESGFRLTSDPVDPTIRDRIAKALGIQLAAGEILTDHVILAAVERIHKPSTNVENPEEGMVYKRGETLAEAVAHGRAERTELADRVQQLTNVIGRVAGALGLGQWNKDGDEIVEKANRWNTFALWLKKRYQEAVGRAELAHRLDEQALAHDSAVAEREAVVAELRTVLAGLVAEKDLAKYIQKRPQTIGGLAFTEAMEPYKGPQLTGERWLDLPFTSADIKMLADFLRPNAEHDSRWLELMARVSQSSVLADDLCDFMNLVLLPALRRQRAGAAAAQPQVH
jgi:hypothetical protein